MTARYSTIKTDTSMRVKGFGWDWYHHIWTKNDSTFTVDELTEHLKWIARKEKKRKLVPPTKPQSTVPQRKKMGILGTPTVK